MKMAEIKAKAGVRAHKEKLRNTTEARAADREREKHEKEKDERFTQMGPNIMKGRVCLGGLT